MEGIILSSWDYIMGPQIERLWITSYNPKLNIIEVPIRTLKEFNLSKHCKSSDVKNELKEQYDLNAYSLMCGQLLLGEMDTSEMLEENASRTYISDTNVLISVVFRLKSWIPTATNKEVQNSCMCIGLIYKRDAFTFILQNQFTFDTHLRKIADILQISKLPLENAFNGLSDSVMTSTSYLNSLYYNNIHCVQTHVLSSIEDYLTSSNLSEAIVSHLQTSGHTAILGGSEFKINQVINILSLFSNKEELNISLPISHWPLKSKVSTLYIQGIIKSSEKDCDYLLENAFDESSALTVIDTDRCKVWHTWPQLENLDKNRIFSPVTETGCFVPQLLKDLSFADKNKADCQIIVANFMKLLMMKASAVIKTVLHFRNMKRILSKQELMALFAVYTVVDLQIILGCAEKLKPGIRCSIS